MQLLVIAQSTHYANVWYLHMQLVSLPDHVPLLRHFLLALPSKRNPSSQTMSTTVSYGSGGDLLVRIVPLSGSVNWGQVTSEI